MLNEDNYFTPSSEQTKLGNQSSTHRGVRTILRIIRYRSCSWVSVFDPTNMESFNHKTQACDRCIHFGGLGQIKMVEGYSIQ